jgi:phage terminase large subunit-like protein
MQRLHQDDLIGHVLPQDDWTVLSFPAIAEEAECVPFRTPYGVRRFTRQPGEALHPDREAVAEYEAMRRRIGLYNFSSQYQQRPIPISGNLVKREWLRSYGPDDVPRRFTRVVQSWDTAAKTSELNDYSVCTTWGVERENYYLIDVFRRRLNYPDLKRAIVSHAKRFDADKIVIEAKAQALSSSRIFRTTASGRSSSTNHLPAPTRSCACTPAATGSKAAVWSCRATPPGWTSTSLSSSAFQAQDTTTRSTRPPRRSTTSAIPDLVATYIKAFGVT